MAERVKIEPLPGDALTRLAAAFPREMHMTVIGDESDMTIMTDNAIVRRRIVTREEAKEIVREVSKAIGRKE